MNFERYTIMLEFAKDLYLEGPIATFMHKSYIYL